MADNFALAGTLRRSTEEALKEPGKAQLPFGVRSDSVDIRGSGASGQCAAGQ